MSVSETPASKFAVEFCPLLADLLADDTTHLCPHEATLPGCVSHSLSQRTDWIGCQSEAPDLEEKWQKPTEAPQADVMGPSMAKNALNKRKNCPECCHKVMSHFLGKTRLRCSQKSSVSKICAILPRGFPRLLHLLLGRLGHDNVLPLRN